MIAQLKQSSRQCFHFYDLDKCHTQITSVTTTDISHACHKCGTMAKSGKRSCCGPGGSWHKNCGSAGNANSEHTWHEGIRACKARLQSKTVIGHLLKADQQNVNDSFTDMVTVNIDHTSTTTPIISQGLKSLSKFVVHTTLLLITIAF